jgi:hypothetical protein
MQDQRQEVYKPVAVATEIVSLRYVLSALKNYIAHHMKKQLLLEV